MTQPPEYVTTTPGDPNVHTIPGGQSGVELPGEQKLLDLRGKFWELLIQRFLQAIFGAFNPAGGSAFSQLSSWASSVPFIGGTISSAINFITSFLDPAKLLFSQTRVENPPQGGWPKTFNYEWGELVATPIELLVQNLSRFLTPGSLTGGNLVSAAFSIPTSILSFIEGILLPRSRVAELDPATGLVPDSQKPQAVQDIVDHANNAFAGNPVGAVINFGVNTFFDVIGGIFGAGSNAQNVNIIQNANIDALLVGGSASGITDTFDGAESFDLLPNFSQVHFDGGSGTVGRDGDGNAVFHNSGGSGSGYVNRHGTVTTTDTQKVSIVLNSNLGNANVSDSWVALEGRVKADCSERVEASIYYNSAEIGYYIAGVYTRLGAIQSLSGNTAGSWDLKLGTGTSTREFILYHNGTEVMRRTDGGAASALGVNNRGVGFTMYAGVSFFWVYIQASVPPIDSFSASDRLASS